MDKRYYAYLISPAGTEFIGSGTKEQVEVIKAEQEKSWQPGDLWFVKISDKELKETNYWD